MLNKRTFSRGFYFDWKIFKITIKQIKPIIWISLSVVVLGTINYEGKIFTIRNDDKVITGLNAIIYQIFIAYITGFILIFLFEMLKKTKKRISVSTSVGNNVLLIKERVDYILNEIGKKHKEEKKEFEINEDELRTCCENIEIDTDVVRVWYYPNYSFRQFVIKSCEEIKTATDEILAFSDAFDEKWAYSLSVISGLSTKVVKSLDIRFPVPKIEFYFLWGLYAETCRLMELLHQFNKDHFKLAIASAPRFHPSGLTFNVDKKK